MKPMTVVRGYALAFIAASSAVAYLSFTTPVVTERPDEQAALYLGVPEVEPGPPPAAQPAPEGDALAYLRIPRFGDEWLWVAMEGTSPEALASGPGHFTDSALPGEQGNSAYAGHRSGHGEPFGPFDLLQPGDEIVVAQDGAEWTYRVRFSPRIIEPDESWVTQQHTRAGREFAAPRLTLITCWPRYGSSHRLYVRAVLTETIGSST